MPLWLHRSPPCFNCCCEAPLHTSLWICLGTLPPVWCMASRGAARARCAPLPLLLVVVVLAVLASQHRAAGFLRAPAAAAQRGQRRMASGGPGSVVANAKRQGMREVAEQYDSFFVDAWGVLHDGSKPYPGVIECLEQLAARGKRIVLLSNSSRRKGSVLKGLTKLGFNTDLLVDVVTSGDVAWQGLRDRSEEPFASLGTKCLVLGNGDDDIEYVQSAGLTLADADACDFVIARGSFALTGSTTKVQDKSSIMERAEVVDAMAAARARGVPMLVTNPDFLRPGTNDPMPGLIGKQYAAAGGDVHWVGKPYALVYARCRAAAGGGSGGSGGEGRACGVGDSLSHDIKGALAAGIDSVFVAAGVHSAEMGVEQGADAWPDDADLSRVITQHLPAGAAPTHMVTTFKW